jgi:hypothetical protein
MVDKLENLVNLKPMRTYHTKPFLLAFNQEMVDNLDKVKLETEDNLDNPELTLTFLTIPFPIAFPQEMVKVSLVTEDNLVNHELKLISLTIPFPIAFPQEMDNLVNSKLMPISLIKLFHLKSPSLLELPDTFLLMMMLTRLLTLLSRHSLETLFLLSASLTTVSLCSVPITTKIPSDGILLEELVLHPPTLLFS